ncbi:MAG: MFS transporter, partial [Lactococcus sp.]
MKRKEHLAIVIAIFIATFMTSVEVTIVTTAMPTIISQLKGLELQSWVFAIYLLISAIATPIYGKLADNLGRKNIFIFGLVSFVIGSILCGIAPNMLFLIIFRAIQGIGAGAVMPLTFTIIADLFDFEERAKIMALNNTAWAISALVGPLLGGWIVDTLGWHWVFFINVPLGLITLLLTIFGYKDVHEKTAKQPMDWAGIASLSVLLVSLLLMFQEMSASTINWLLEVVLLFLIVAASIIFIRTEKKAVDPLFNLEMFKTRTFSIQIIISMLLSGCLIAFNIYFTIWL